MRREPVRSRPGDPVVWEILYLFAFLCVIAVFSALVVFAAEAW